MKRPPSQESLNAEYAEKVGALDHKSKTRIDELQR